jgi:2-keto-3-deoxy-L-rhamnonate aldolase RhmA
MDSLENKTKKKLKAGELTLCMAVNQMRTADVAMIAASCGFDALFVDLEHGPTSLESASLICVAALGAGITPIARIASHHANDMARILDSGAQGLMVPHIETAAEAEEIVRYCRFPPIGHRSTASTGPGVHYRKMTTADINRRLNEETLLIAMLETPNAIENADSIAAVPGIDMVHIGAVDVTSELGVPGDLRDPRMMAGFKKVSEACRKYGKAMGVGGARGDAALQKDLIDLGVRYLTIGSDVSFLMAAASKDVAALRALGVG